MAELVTKVAEIIMPQVEAKVAELIAGGTKAAMASEFKASETRIQAAFKAEWDKIGARVVALEGEMPAGVKRGFRASEDASTALAPGDKNVRPATPQPDPIGTFVTDFVIGKEVQPSQPA